MVLLLVHGCLRWWRAPGLGPRSGPGSGDYQMAGPLSTGQASDSAGWLQGPFTVESGDDAHWLTLGFDRSDSPWGLGVVVGCGRIAPRGFSGRAPVSRCVAVVVWCGTLPISVGGVCLPASAVGAPCCGWLVESRGCCAAGRYCSAASLATESGGVLGASAPDGAGALVFLSALAAAAGSGWMRWKRWGTGTAKGPCWGRTPLVSLVCQSWTSTVPEVRRSAPPGILPYSHISLVVVGLTGY